jgi:hypothetical protein
MDSPAAASITDLIYEGSLGVFVLVTLILGGGASLLAGRAIAQTWRPWWHIVFYMMILGCAVRFFHFSLFGGTLLSVHYYLVDTAVCMLAGLAGYRAARTTQMLNQYRWINEPAGPMRWRRRPQ